MLLGNIRLILMAALVALVAAGAAGLYVKGRADFASAAALKVTQGELEATRAALETERRVRQSDAIAQAQARERIAKLSSTINALEDHLATIPDAGAECLSDADAVRLRDLWP